MADNLSQRAILSVYDKQGLETLGEGLVALGWALIASGGTATHLREKGLPVTDVAAVTGAPEMIGGRVKTLHPAIHAGILAKPTQRDMSEIASHGIEPIGLVICNLYPFEQTIAQPDVSLERAVEQIDIGGVTLLRAGAKNFARVITVCDPDDYGMVLGALRGSGLPLAERQSLALKAFQHTRDYDTAIATFLEYSLPGSE